MQLKTFPINESLEGLIEKIWLFKSEGELGSNDLKMIVPNGRIKLVIPFNDVMTQTNGNQVLSEGNKIFLLGLIDVPRIINDQKNNPSGTIGIEFNPAAAYRFFKVRFANIINTIIPLNVVIGGEVIQLEQELSQAASIEIKIDLLQQFILKLMSPVVDEIFIFCIQRIESTKGQVTIVELEKETGYSRRWLNMKFKERLGISPKNFAGIIRFSEIYKHLHTNPIKLFSQKEFYDQYHDQSHFINDFKKFAGMPPARFTKAVNDFGKTFFKT